MSQQRPYFIWSAYSNKMGIVWTRSENLARAWGIRKLFLCDYLSVYCMRIKLANKDHQYHLKLLTLNI